MKFFLRHLFCVEYQKMPRGKKCVYAVISKINWRAAFIKRIFAPYYIVLNYSLQHRTGDNYPLNAFGSRISQKKLEV
jgi:hypothetical protein